LKLKTIEDKNNDAQRLILSIWMMVRVRVITHNNSKEDKAGREQFLCVC
jgi:hypothetical protein